MNNKLEGFVKNNKKEFEVKGPSDQLWERIAAELDKKQQPKKNFRLYQWMSIAAILVISFGIYLNYNHKQNSQGIAVADVSKRLGEKEIHFVSLIEEKKDSLQVYEKDNPELYNKFTTDMAKLNSDYEKLKKQLQTSPNPAIVVRAMMKNLELQSDILTQQLIIINQVNQYKKENSI
jgi:hypothetical protein